MIFADKLISLRKRAGWSQEELANQLNVTRQSVSKWEGAQSIPDLDKIVQLSRLFGVTTDYLLKDELEEPENAPEDTTPALRRVSLEEAAAYLACRHAVAPQMALATLLCILSPTPLLALAALSEIPAVPVSERTAVSIGMCLLLLLVAAGVALFLSVSNRSRDFAFLDKAPFETEYGVAGMVQERQKQFAPTAARLYTVGTVLCILAAVPLFLSAGLATSDLVGVLAFVLMLLLVGLGCMAFVYAGTVNGAMSRLLEEGANDGSRKRQNAIRGTVSTVYWLAVTAVFLLYTFGPNGNGHPQYSWFIWAIGWVLYAAVMAVVSLLTRPKK